MIEKTLNSISLHYLKIKNQFKILENYSYFSIDYLKLIRNLKKYFRKRYKQFIEICEKVQNDSKQTDDFFFLNDEEYESNISIFLNLSKSINILLFDFINVNAIHFHQVNFILIKKFIGADSQFIILPEQSRVLLQPLMLPLWVRDPVFLHIQQADQLT